MASNSGWSKGLPSGSSNIALGDNDIRSNQSVVQAAFEDEHYFTDGSTNSAGVHKAGSARAWYQAAAPTAVNPVGQLWIDSDNSSMKFAYAAGTGSWSTLFSGGIWTTPASDSVHTIITIGVTTTPQIVWDEPFHKFKIAGASDTPGLQVTGNVEFGTTGTANTHNFGKSGNYIGFYGATAVAQQTGVAVTAAAIHAALVNLGLITA